ncbi:hypothetical protein KUCAC02_011724 [Chaenocephalus aceratus]|uniref:Uncharacterized protein n=1 Tax=Chaenocephalus aceratus TaxID=36190 RepID=A0ACB9WXL7_CHAAC|nr:hypothetical protein KUCAC02_011724 [Chaenocephalus aceratus]
MYSSALLILASLDGSGLFLGLPPWRKRTRPAQHRVSRTGVSDRGVPSARSLIHSRNVCVQRSVVWKDAVHQLISNGTGNAISVSQFTDVAAGCVLYLSSPGLVCSAVRQGRWGEEAERFLHELTHQEHQHGDSGPHQEHQHEHIDVHALQVLLQKLHHQYVPMEKVLTASDIMPEVSASPAEKGQEVGAVLGRVLYHALRGHCFISRALPEESFFMDDIMERLGSENFTVEDLEALMKSLKLGPDNQHQHEHGHTDSHADHDHSGFRRTRKSGHTRHEGHAGNTTWDKLCLSAEELVLIHSLAENSSAPPGLGQTGLARLSPALVQQILSGACAEVTDPVTHDELTVTERYLYATLANVVITLTSMFGIVLLLCTSCTSMFQLCIQFCISLAVGTLTGDALLHLLPMFLGLHVHSDNASSHEECRTTFTRCWY